MAEIQEQRRILGGHVIGVVAKYKTIKDDEEIAFQEKQEGLLSQY